jgi:type I restriction enzyme S subunit
MSEERYELPEGWTWTKLGEICEKPQYGWTTSADLNGRGLKLLRTTDISSGAINWGTVPFCDREPDEPKKYLLNKGDILVSRAGSVGVSIEINDCTEAIFASYLIRFKPIPPIYPRFISLYLKSPYYWNCIADNTAGIAIPNVNATKLQALQIPLPPLNEQKRIVAKIEFLFGRVDTTKRELAQIPLLLKKFRQSVLAKAFSGELTKDWRKEQKDLEPGLILLERIREERKKKLGKKYKELEPIDISDLPELPERWGWASLGDIIENAQPGFASGKKDVPNGLCHLRMNNIDSECNLNLDLVRTVPKSLGEEKYLLRKGDVLFCHTNSQKLIGKTALFAKDGKYAFSNHLTRLRFFDNTTKSEWIWYYLSTLWRQGYFENKCKQWVNQATIERDTLLRVPVPIPPILEQVYAIKKIKELFAQADTIEKSVKIAQAHCEKLAQSILAKAFRGELVEQDPNDEPAHDLLKRIENEKSRTRSK